MTFQEGAGLDGQVLVQDIADHMRRACQRDRARLDLAIERAVYDHRLSDDFSLDVGAFADQKSFAPDIALNGTVNLNFAIAF